VLNFNRQASPMKTANIQKNTLNVQKTTFTVTMLSFIPHLLCCVIPIGASLIALGTTIGLGAALASNPIYSFVNEYHVHLLVFATIMVALSGAFNLYAYQVDCAKTASACTHKSCKPKKLRSFRIFLISLFLLFLDFSWFVFETNFLGFDS